jgi:hypothetical protein
VLDSRGWFHEYIHLLSFDPSVKLGGRVKKGQKIATLGKEGTSGGWSHLHYEIVGRQPSGKWGTVEGYVFLWEAYLREHKPDLIAVARPHHAALAGENVVLDGSRSWSRDSKITRYEWTFSDGSRATGARAAHTCRQPGNYAELLKVTDAKGRTAYDVATVNVLDAAHRDQLPPAVHAAYSPSLQIRPGDTITFKARTFGTTDGEEKWEFGDRGTGVTKSDGNVVPMAKDGYAATTHVYRQPGDYIVTVERSNARGQKGIARLAVRVSSAPRR